MIAKSNVYNGEDKSQYLKEGVKVLFGGQYGVVQVVYNNLAYVLFRDGSLKSFSLSGKYLGQYQKEI